MNIITSPRLITPINTLAQGIASGNFVNGDHCQHLLRLNILLKQVEASKAVHFVCFDTPVEASKYVTTLATLRKTPCSYGANFLLGYLAEVNEENMPPELKDRFLVAADPGSTILDSTGNQAFLCARREKSYRIIDIANGRMGWAGRWAFLVEDTPV